MSTIRVLLAMLDYFFVGAVPVLLFTLVRYLARCALHLTQYLALPGSRLPWNRARFVGQILLFLDVIDTTLAVLHRSTDLVDALDAGYDTGYKIYLALGICDLLVLLEEPMPVAWWILRSKGAIIDSLTVLWYCCSIIIRVRNLH